MDEFKINGIKKTKQREIVYNYIKEKNEIYLNQIIKEVNIDKSTVYRIIELFLSKNLIEKKVDESKNVYYTLKEKEHNHYINCNVCHKRKKISDKKILNFEKNIIDNNDFVVTSHNIEFRGICKDCKGKC